MILVQCEHCGAKLRVKDALAGRSGKCPRCGKRVRIESSAAPKKDRAAVTPSPSPSSTPSPAIASQALQDTKKRPVDNPDAPIPFDSLEDEDDSEAATIILPSQQSLGDHADIHASHPSSVGQSSGIGRSSGVGSSSGIGHPSGIGLASGIGKADSSRSSAIHGGVTLSEGGHILVPVHLDIKSHYIICDYRELIGRWENDGRGWLIRLKDGFARAATVASYIPEFGKFVLIEIGVERRDDGLHLKSITGFTLQEHYGLVKLTRGDDAILSAITGIAILTHQQRGHVREVVKSKFLPHIWPEMDALLREI